MEAIEFEAQIDKNGFIYIPEKFKSAYGQIARLVVLLPERDISLKKRRKQGSAKELTLIILQMNE